MGEVKYVQEIIVYGENSKWRNVLQDNYMLEENVWRNMSGRTFCGRKV